MGCRRSCRGSPKAHIVRRPLKPDWSMDLAAAEQVSDVIEHLFWGGRAYLAQSLMCAGGPKTASISTGPRTVRRRSEASEPCGAYRKRIEPRCREFRGSSNLNSTLGDTETAKTDMQGPGQSRTKAPGTTPPDRKPLDMSLHACQPKSSREYSGIWGTSLVRERAAPD